MQHEQCVWASVPFATIVERLIKIILHAITKKEILISQLNTHHPNFTNRFCHVHFLQFHTDCWHIGMLLIPVYWYVQWPCWILFSFHYLFIYPLLNFLCWQSYLYIMSTSFFFLVFLYLLFPFYVFLHWLGPLVWYVIVTKIAQHPCHILKKMLLKSTIMCNVCYKFLVD